MRREILNVIENDVEIPEIVLKATEKAFAQIPDDVPEQTKGTVVTLEKKKFKKKWIALVAVAILVVGTLSAGATNGFKWYQQLSEKMFVSDAEKNTAEKYNLENTQNLSVKDKGVTITVEQTLSDSEAFYVVLSIEGKPEPQNAYQSITFYDFLISSKDGVQGHDYGGEYIGIDAETGKMLYLWEGLLPESETAKDTLVLELGKLANMELVENPEGDGYDFNEIWRVDGQWKFEIPLEGGTVEMDYVFPDKPVYSGVELLRAKVTPLALELEWSEPSGINEFYGYLMSDGSVKYASHGATGYGEPQLGGVVTAYKYGTIVDVEHVEAILLWDMEKDPDTRAESQSAEDFIVIPLPEK